MNTYYNDEDTIYEGSSSATNPQNEKTHLEGSKSTSQDVKNSNEGLEKGGNEEVEVVATKTKDGWKKVGAGAAGGLLIGSVATFLMGMKSAHDNDPIISQNHKEALTHPEWVDDKVPVATNVNDHMSFSQAFAAARAEVGPGGCFEWHGQIYGTYTADEWNHMTAEQRAEYSDHFSWNNIDHNNSNVAHHSTQQNNTDIAQNDDDIEVVQVAHNLDTDAPHNSGEDVNDGGGLKSEVEILGVVHDTDTGANFGGVSIDGQEVILVDVDGDMEFDFMGADLNENGQLDEGEVVDIQGQGLTVNDLGGFTHPGGDLTVSDDNIDYSEPSDLEYEV